MGCFTACDSNKDIQETRNIESFYTNETVSETVNETEKTENKESAKTEEIKETESTESTENTNSTETLSNTTCSHNSTIVKNKKSATCTVNGYTGDTYCTKCGKKLSSGSTISAAHKTEIRNKKDATATSEGYTGDTVCTVCNTIIKKGQTIAKKSNDVPTGKVKYTTDNGYVYIVDNGTDIMAYSMKKQTKQISEPYRAIELEILRLCNEERAKNGLASLEWYEDAYYFTHIRAEESIGTFSHTRPNQTNWDTVYKDANVILNGTWGENLFYFEGTSTKGIAKVAFDAWMDSPGHKANILNAKYDKIAIAIYEKKVGETVCLAATQNFFGPY